MVYMINLKMDGGMKLANKFIFQEWAVVAVQGLIYFLIDSRSPMPNEFTLNDPSIQYDMAVKETVPDALCLILAVVMPAIYISLSLIANNPRKNRMYLMNMSLLGLFMAFTLNGMLTNIWKLWLARPRPDFLSRCIPKDGTPTDIPVTIDVCTNDQLHIIMDGFKSLPSGHSSSSFVGLTYFSLWLSGQLRSFRRGAPTYLVLLSFSPMLLASYIAISRVRDYRHRYSDVFFGALLGTSIALYHYFRFFPRLSSAKSNEPYKFISSVNDDSELTDSELV